MKITFISDLQCLGGAGIAAARLANGLSELGHSVEWLFNNSDRVPFGEAVHWESSYIGPPRPAEVALNGLRRLAPAPSRELGHALSARLLDQALSERHFDVLHVHAIHNSYWDHRTLGAISPDLPTVWTFHDHWGFSPESYLFVDLEGRTIRLKPDGEDREAAMARRRRYFASRRRLRLAANSRATAALAKENLGLEAEVIPYGLPLELLTPIPRAAARAALAFPQDAFVVGFIADNRETPIKGIQVLRRALASLGTTRRVEAIAIGEGACGTELVGSVPIRLMGRVANPLLLAPLYAACDVFVVPSLAEALGMVSMEAIACGTPVIGSNVGGIPDVVREGQTGWLFPRGDAAALAAILERLLADPAGAARLGEGCRRIALAEWSLRRQAERYAAMYDELLGASAS